VKTLLVDDHAVFRDALASLLTTRSLGIDVVASVGDARSGLEAVHALSPDVVILDIMLRGPSGISLARELRDIPAALRPRILVLTAVEEPAFVVDALGAGVTGYALKTQGADDILEAFDCTARGQRYLAPAIEQHATAPPPATGDVLGTLSKREREVFDLATAGHCNEAIGRALFISVKTVETHRARINRKLHVHSTVQLIRLAALHGLTPAV
jgi:two-component system response regulator NreC